MHSRALRARRFADDRSARGAWVASAAFDYHDARLFSRSARSRAGSSRSRPPREQSRLGPLSQAHCDAEGLDAVGRDSW